MKRIGLLVLMMAVFLIGCSTKGRKSSAPKDDSKVGKEGEHTSDEEMFEVFKTVDLEGNEVDHSFFESYEITMVNFWGSTCRPCLEELDELEEIRKRLPEKATILGVLADVPMGYEAGIERAKNAMQSTGATFTNLLLDESLRERASDLSFTPYTIFVDKKGRIVGNAVKGANIEKYIEELESLVEGFQY